VWSLLFPLQNVSAAKVNVETRNSSRRSIVTSPEISAAAVADVTSRRLAVGRRSVGAVIGFVRPLTKLLNGGEPETAG